MQNLVGALTRLAKALENDDTDWTDAENRKLAEKAVRAAVEVLLEQERAA